MIPKVIHYCWFGEGEYSPLMLTCLNSWEKNLPGWSIKKWDEKNSPIHHPFLKKALKDKEYAFASDYMRVYVLYNYGGVYLDTDIEILKNIENLLNNDFFIAYENSDESLIGTAVIGSKSKHIIVKKTLEWYERNNFYIANPKIITPIIKDYMESHKNDSIKLLKNSTFYPYNPFDRNQKIKQLTFSHIKEDTYGIHHWAYSWDSGILKKIIRFIKSKVKSEI